MNVTDYSVYVDSISDKTLFFDFWKLPYSTNNQFDANASIINGTGFRAEYNSSIVLLEGNGKPRLYRLANGISIFAKIRKLHEFPDNLEVITPVLDQKSNVISHILRDTKNKVVYLPFSPDEVLDSFYFEKYLGGTRKTFLPRHALNLYYSVKSIIPQSIITQARIGLTKIQRRRDFPSWPFESSLEDFKHFIMLLLLSVSKTQALPFIWFWPNSKQVSLLLTHDIESGLKNNGGIDRIIAAERKHRFKSAFNVVPFKYHIDEEVIDDMKSCGCEIGVHGYSHDSKLFSNYEIFERRVKDINRIAKKWGAVGFRSASTYRNPYWCKLMEFDYDCSFFDTDPYEPQPGGCLSLFPYFIGNLVEIPITMPQDYTLFVLLKQKDIGMWYKKAQEIRKRNGMMCLIAHPDEGYIGDEDKEKHYIEFLDSVSRDPTIWNPLPKDLAYWWKCRHTAKIVVRDNSIQIEGGTPEMSIKWAKVVDGELSFEENLEMTPMSSINQDIHRR